MNTQYNFLDNAVNDESELTGAKDMGTKMCSYPQNDTEDVCPTSHDDTCGDGMCFGQQKPDDVIQVGVDLDELEVIPAEAKTIYGEIKAYVK